jgi:hypothetical protein
MNKILTHILACLLGIIIGAFLNIMSTAALDILGSPKVTLINATGNTLSNVVISLGNTRREIRELKDGQSLTVPIQGSFGECSTHVTWTDSKDKHEASANDYVENCGSYHTTIVLTPDAKAQAILEIKESFQANR